jgi:asparagine synthase (glutamine-hydrolysing)
MASDAELILRAYEVWGVDAAPRLLGDFAFAIWDPRRKQVVCARDTSGQRSLFYRVDHRIFAAASEIHQLLQDPTVPVAPDEAHIRDFLVPINTFRVEKNSASTFYAGISAVEAGHVLVIDHGDVRTHRYWDLGKLDEVRYRTDQEYADHFLDLFSEVVRVRLRSARPVGAMLSGGLDSSSIVCTAQELYRTRHAENNGFTSYSYVFGGLDCDERGLIQDIQDKYACNVRYLDQIEGMAWLEEDPDGFQESPTSNVSQRTEVYRAATQDGVRALLTGMVADACVPGSPLVFDSLLRKGQFRTFLRYLRAYRRTSNWTLRKLLALAVVGPMLPMGMQRQLMIRHIQRSFGREQPVMMPWWMPDPLRDELSLRHLTLSVEAERERRFSSLAREADFRLLYPPENDRSPVGWPLEFRHPYADRRLHQFLLAIPPEQKYAPHPTSEEDYASTKWLVRRAMRDILPESIRTRTSKTYFTAVFDNELSRRWTSYEAIFGPDARPEIAERGYVDQERFWMRLQAGRNGADLPDAMYVVRMVGLESWLRSLRLPRARLATVPDRRYKAASPVSTPPAQQVLVGASPSI